MYKKNKAERDELKAEQDEREAKQIKCEAAQDVPLIAETEITDDEAEKRRKLKIWKIPVFANRMYLKRTGLLRCFYVYSWVAWVYIGFTSTSRSRLFFGC